MRSAYAYILCLAYLGVIALVALAVVWMLVLLAYAGEGL